MRNQWVLGDRRSANLRQIPLEFAMKESSGYPQVLGFGCSLSPESRVPAVAGGLSPESLLWVLGVACFLSFEDPLFHACVRVGVFPNMVQLTEEKLDPQRAVEAVMTEADGAYVLFVGVVRNHSRGRTVTGLEYQVYAPMAEPEMQRLIEQVAERWKLRCAILHRYGFIPVGEAAVVVCVAGAHRGEAFDACRWTIDTLKADVPIWKKEFAADGTYWIEGNDAIRVAGMEE